MTDKKAHEDVTTRLTWADSIERAVRHALAALGYHEAESARADALLALLVQWVAFLIAYKTDSHGLAASMWAEAFSRYAPAAGSMTLTGAAKEAVAFADAGVAALVQRFPPVHAIRPSGEPIAADELHGLHIEAARVELASCLDKDPDATGLGELASECTAEIVRLRAEYRSAVDALRKTRETIDAASKALYCEPGILANYCVAVQQTLNGIALALTECETMPAYNNLETAVRHVVRLWRDAREQALLANEMFNGAKNAADVAVSQANRLRGEVRSALAAQNRAESERDAMRIVLDECTEQGDAARDVLAKVLDIEPDACSLPEMANRVAEALAMGQRARTIAAESEAARLRAELHTAQRELATMRERAGNAGREANAPHDDASVIRKLSMTVSDVESLLNTNDVPHEKTLLERVHALIQQRDAARATAAVPLPTPDRIEPGQRWALTVLDVDDEPRVYVLFGPRASSEWLSEDIVKAGAYLGMAPSAES